MPQKYQAENRLRRRAIQRVVQTVVHQVDQADRHHIAQIAVADLLHQPLTHVAHPIVILAVDHAENRNKENNENVYN